jgi:nitroreductase
MGILALTPDELLSTTRSVRRRIDFDRAVPRALLEECVQLAVQAPSASDTQPWHFVIVTEPDAKRQIGEWYRKSWQAYDAARSDPPPASDPGVRARRARLSASSRYLAERFGEVPAHVIPCVSGRPQTRPAEGQAAAYSSILQAAWSFQLAARARTLGTCWTTLHLAYEREVASLLQIPYERVAQVGLITVGYALGSQFQPAWRRPISEVVHYDRW